ncbi:MAG: hypothetical protein KC493_16075 [Bacteriovoracaceae bacterium]|nr:hypothetical protein [Bacteriovoracaceae bacterium]
MKIIVLISFIITISYSTAGTISFIGPCSSDPVFKTQFSIDNISNAGKVTIDTLKKFNIPHIGTAQGMNSIFDTPTGSDAIEVVSDNEMHAYGWCFSVNGFEPAEYPVNIEVLEKDHILWWFGYATFKDGQWITQCTPSHTRQAAQFCN